MDEAAAPQAAEGKDAADVKTALDTLRLVYDDRFRFGYDPVASPREPWWAVRDGQVGSMVTAPGPVEIGRRVEDVYGGDPS